MIRRGASSVAACFALTVEVVALGDGRDVLVARPRDAVTLLNEEAFDARDEYLPYWAELWPSAIALARVVARAR